MCDKKKNGQGDQEEKTLGGFLLTIEQLENCRSAKGESVQSLRRDGSERIKSDRERMTQTITGMPQSGKANRPKPDRGADSKADGAGRAAGGQAVAEGNGN